MSPHLDTAIAPLAEALLRKIIRDPGAYTDTLRPIGWALMWRAGELPARPGRSGVYVQAWSAAEARQLLGIGSGDPLHLWQVLGRRGQVVWQHPAGAAA